MRDDAPEIRRQAVVRGVELGGHRRGGFRGFRDSVPTSAHLVHGETFAAALRETLGRELQLASKPLVHRRERAERRRHVGRDARELRGAIGAARAAVQQKLMLLDAVEDLLDGTLIRVAVDLESAEADVAVHALYYEVEQHDDGQQEDTTYRRDLHTKTQTPPAGLHWILSFLGRINLEHPFSSAGGR